MSAVESVTEALISEWIHLLGAIAAALAVRYLLGVSTPSQDWAALCALANQWGAIVDLPSPLAGVNMARLEHMRQTAALGGYQSDRSAGDVSHGQNELTATSGADSRQHPNNTGECLDDNGHLAQSTH